MKQTCLACASVHVYRKYTGVGDYEYGTHHAVDYLWCSNCGLLMQDPLPASKQIHSFYPADYRSHSQGTIGRLFVALKDIQFRLLVKKIDSFDNKNAKVLEIGCGNGMLLVKLQKMGLSRLWGTDISNAAAKLLSRKRILFRRADIEKKFPFYELFDVIILHNVIEHLLNPTYVLDQCKAHLSGKGKIIIITPNSDALEHGIFKRYWDGINAPRHIFIFSVRAVETLAKRMDFRKLTSIPLPDPGQWAISLQNVWQNVPFLRTRLVHGLAWYTKFLIMLCIPISLLAGWSKQSSSRLYILE